CLKREQLLLRVGGAVGPRCHQYAARAVLEASSGEHRAHQHLSFMVPPRPLRRWGERIEARQESPRLGRCGPHSIGGHKNETALGESVVGGKPMHALIAPPLGLTEL